MPGATVTANHTNALLISGTTTTSLDGRFEFTDLQVGSTGVWVDSPQYVRDAKVLQVPASNVQFRLAREGAIVEGRTVLRTTGEPVSSATVSLALQFTDRRMPRSNPRWRFKAVSDVDGRFRFERLPEGQYQLGAAKAPLRLFDEKGSSQVWLRDRETTSGMVVPLFAGYVLNGRVVDVETSQPLEGVKISPYYSQDREAEVVETTASGAFRMAGLPARSDTLLVQKSGYCLAEPGRRDSSIGWRYVVDDKKSEQIQDILMRRSLTLSGTVRTEWGEPVAAAQVQVLSEAHRMLRTPPSETIADGAFSFEVFPRTDCRLKVTAKDFPSTCTDIINIKDSSISDVVIPLLPGCTVSGTVADACGRAIAGARVKAFPTVLAEHSEISELRDILIQIAYNQIGPVGEVTSAADGTYELRNLPYGKICLFGSKNGYYRNRLEAIDLKAGETRRDYRIALRSQGFISGRVTDNSGQPLAGADVRGYSKATDYSDLIRGYATTDANGVYKMSELVESTYTLSVSHDDCEDGEREVAGINLKDVDFKLARLNTGSVVATVVDWKTLQPVSAFEVRGSRGPKPEKDVQVPGRFVLHGLKQGEWASVEVLAEGYMKARHDFSLKPGETEQQTKVKVAPEGIVKGRAVSRGEHKPVSGADVIVNGDRDSRAPTGSDGSFEVHGLPAGTGSVGIRPAGKKLTIYHPFTARSGEKIDLGDIEIGDGATVKVQVVQMPGGKPAAGVVVRVRGLSDKQLSTGEDGVATFAGLSPGHVSVQLPDKSVAFDSGFSVADGETKTVRVVLGGAILKGKVLQAGKPVPWARVWATNMTPLWSRNVSARADTEGRFTLEALAPGPWEVNVLMEANPDCSVVETVDVGEDGTTEKDFVLPSGSIVGRVVNAQNEPVARAHIEVRVPGGGARQITENRPEGRLVSCDSQQDGRFLMEGLPSGSYTVSARKDGADAAVARDVKVPEVGNSREVVLRFGEGGQGTLVSTAFSIEDGQPLQASSCTAFDSTGLLVQSDDRDNDGVARIEHLPVGTYRVIVGATGYKEVEHVVEIKDGETVTLQDVLSLGGSFAWGLQDKNGKPLSGVECTLRPNDPASLEEPRSGTSNRTGMWSLVGGVEPGPYTATATPQGKQPTTEKVEIKAGVPTVIMTTIE